MNEKLHDALEVCRAAVATGVSIEAALGLYPDLAAELRPALEGWQALATLGIRSDPPAVRRHRSRTQLLRQAAMFAPKDARRLSRAGAVPRFALAGVVVVLVLFLGWGGLATASAQSLPGDPLYRVKRANEDLELRLTAGDRHSELEDEFAERRSSELQGLLELGRSAEVEFTGVVRARMTGGWDVDGVLVIVGSETEVKGEIATGVTVKVEGATAADGSVLAREVRLAGLALEGTVEAIGAGAWTISGRQVAVGPSTTLSIGLRIGDRVLALIDVQDDGASTARAILYLGPGSPTPEPAQTGRGEWEFEGRVQARSTGAWVVAGQTLLITAETQLDGSLQVGDLARVKAETAPDGRLLALRIQRADGEGEEDGHPLAETGTPTAGEDGSQEMETPEAGSGDSGGSDAGDSELGDTEPSGEKLSFTGEVTDISGSVWTIGGRQVVVNGETELKDDPGLGDEVKVEARSIDGQWVAERIEKE